MRCDLKRSGGAPAPIKVCDTNPFLPRKRCEKFASATDLAAMRATAIKAVEAMHRNASVQEVVAQIERTALGIDAADIMGCSDIDLHIALALHPAPVTFSAMIQMKPMDHQWHGQAVAAMTVYLMRAERAMCPNGLEAMPHLISALSLLGNAYACLANHESDADWTSASERLAYMHYAQGAGIVLEAMKQAATSAPQADSAGNSQIASELGYLSKIRAPIVVAHAIDRLHVYQGDVQGLPFATTLFKNNPPPPPAPGTQPVFNIYAAIDYLIWSFTRPAGENITQSILEYSQLKGARSLTASQVRHAAASRNASPRTSLN